jgi:hypothetical protein
MTAKQLAQELGISRPWLFHLKKKFAAEAPKDFEDVSAWRTFIDSTRLQTKVRGRKSLKGPVELSDYPRLVKLRGDKLELERQKLKLELGVTERRLIEQEEVATLFSMLASILRARFLKLANDLPCSLSGLGPSDIDRILKDRTAELMADFVLPADFFNSRAQS